MSTPSRKRAAPDPDDPYREYKVGSVVRVVCHNFVTYGDVVFEPGPSLNMIIGPNGSGKSTLVCAICLGLGGRPSVLNRAKEIKDFVRNGYPSGWVEVHLRSAATGPNAEPIDVIRREMNATTNSSTWKLNGKAAGEKTILEHVKGLDIQVDNLIQFLPQERVSDFAKLTPEAVLVETEKASEDGALYTMHKNLIDLSHIASRSHESLRLLTTELEGLKRRNASLEPVVQRRREHVAALKQLKLIENKLPWVKYEAARVELVKVKEDRSAAVDELKELESENMPLLERVKQQQKEKEKCEQKKKESSVAFQKTTNSINEGMGRVASAEPHLEEARAKWRKEEAERVAKKRRWKEALEELSQLESRQNEDEKEQSLDEINRRTQQVNEEITTLTEKLRETQTEQSHVQRNMNQLEIQISRLTQDQEKLGNQKDVRLEMLRHEMYKTHASILWLRDNKHLFREEVFEPICMYVNVTDSKFAAEVESMIPRHLMTSFVAQNADDFNTLLSQLKSNGYPANAVTVPPNSSFSFPVPRENLKALGFAGYALDVVQAPEAIKRVLCDSARLHCIPISKKAVDNAAVERLFQSAPDLFQYYADSVSYRFVRSAYSSSVTVSTEDVRNARILSQRQDGGAASEAANQIAASLARQQQERAKMAQQLSTLNDTQRDIIARTGPIKATRDALGVEKKRIQEHNRNIVAHATRLKLKREAVERMRAERARDGEGDETLERQRDEERKAAQQEEEKRIVRVRLGLLTTMQGSFTKMTEAMQARACAVLAIAEANATLNALQSQFAESSGRLAAARAKVDELGQLVEAARKNAFRLRDAALAHCPLTDELRDLFSALPDDLVELQGLLTEVQANVEVTRDENGEQGVIEYEAREKEIASLEVSVQEKKDAYENAVKEVNTVKDEWEPRLRAVIEKVSASFSDYMKKLDYVGECRIGEHEDFEKWTINILVRFRSNEELSYLSASHQSGGERSVCTILYLMSLQSMARSPFRVVDEINQGMDSFNERRVHKIIVDAASQLGTSQYFLITPKLLTGLEYNPRMKVMCVFTGPELPRGREWNINAFIKRARENASEASVQEVAE